MLVVLRSLLLGLEFNHVVDSQDSYGRLSGELETLDLGYGRLEHARRLVVSYLALNQVQTVPILIQHNRI